MVRILITDREDKSVHLVLVPLRMAFYCLERAEKHDCTAQVLQDLEETPQLQSVVYLK